MILNPAHEIAGRPEKVLHWRRRFEGTQMHIETNHRSITGQWLVMSMVFTFWTLAPHARAQGEAGEPPANARVELQAIVLPQKIGWPMIQRLREPALIDGAYAEIQTLLLEGKATLSAWSMTRIGCIGTVRGFVAGTIDRLSPRDYSFYAERIPFETTGNAPTNIHQRPSVDTARLHTFPSSFEANTEGSTLQVDSVVSDGALIRLLLSFKETKAAEASHVTIRYANSQKGVQIEQPRFRDISESTTLALKPGQRILLTASPVSEPRDSLEMVFAFAAVDKTNRLQAPLGNEFPPKGVRTDAQIIFLPIDRAISLIPRLEDPNSFQEAYFDLQAMLRHHDAELIGWPACFSGGADYTTSKTVTEHQAPLAAPEPLMPPSSINLSPQEAAPPLPPPIEPGPDICPPPPPGFEARSTGVTLESALASASGSRFDLNFNLEVKARLGVKSWQVAGNQYGTKSRIEEPEYGVQKLVSSVRLCGGERLLAGGSLQTLPKPGMVLYLLHTALPK